MRLGGPVFDAPGDADGWAAAVKALGYGAAYCPAKADDGDDVLAAYAAAADRAGVVIAEVGAWSNPLSPREETRREALDHCKAQLALADRIGARCCVNITGSRGEQWDGPHADNLTEATFEMVVETVREIIDAARPTRTYYTLETMPWMVPDSLESYVRLTEAIDRERFAVHFDPANLLCSPQRYFGSAALIREFVARLGSRIRSCHGKDIALSGKMTTHLDEVRPGLGGMDYGALLTELDRLDDVPLMLEHLPDPQEYALAAEHVRSVAKEVGVTFR